MVQLSKLTVAASTAFIGGALGQSVNNGIQQSPFPTPAHFSIAEILPTPTLESENKEFNFEIDQQNGIHAPVPTDIILSKGIELCPPWLCPWKTTTTKRTTTTTTKRTTTTTTKPTTTTTTTTEPTTISSSTSSNTEPDYSIITTPVTTQPGYPATTKPTTPATTQPGYPVTTKPTTTITSNTSTYPTGKPVTTIYPTTVPQIPSTPSGYPVLTSNNQPELTPSKPVKCRSKSIKGSE